jgi:glycosyltransferase involved in cell wall biosynthesis
MSCFDIGYYPSGGEGFGNFSSELLALGIPMVYSNYSSHAEICEQGGLPVRVTYIPEIIHGIQRSAVDNGHAVEQVLKLMEDKKLRNDLGESGRRFISNFDLDTMADTWDKIFTELASKPIPLHNNTFHGGIV